ncbi:MAG: ArsR family transcriptional regulator [Candidatus Thorarchaeota archaeon]
MTNDKDEQIDELREEIEELKAIIKDLAKSQSEAYKDFEEAPSARPDKARLEREKRIAEEKAKARRERDTHRGKPDPRPHPRPIHREPLFSKDAFERKFNDEFKIDFKDFKHELENFKFDSKDFEKKMKDLSKKVEKISEEGSKIASKVSEKLSKDVQKYIEKGTEKIREAVTFSDEEYKDFVRDIEKARKELDVAQRQVDVARRGVDNSRRMVHEAQRRLDIAYQEDNIERQKEAEENLRDAEKDLLDAMSDLSQTKSELAQTRREFARLQRRASKIRAAHKGPRPIRIISNADFDADGTITEYVTKVVDSVGKNLESTLRTAFGKAKEVKFDAEKGEITLTKDDKLTAKDTNDVFFENAGNLLSALGDNNRLKILKILEKSPEYQKELSEATGLRGGTFKHHTDILQDEGFITREAIRGRYLITQLGIEALKLAEMIHVRKKRIEEEESIDIDIED